MGLLDTFGDAASAVGKGVGTSAKFVADHPWESAAVAGSVALIAATGGAAAPAVLEGAAIGGSLGAAKEGFDKIDGNPKNDKWDWGTVGSGTAFGGITAGVAAGPRAAEQAAAQAGVDVPNAAGPTISQWGSRIGGWLNGIQFPKVGSMLPAGAGGKAAAAGTAMNAYNNHVIRSDLNNIQANTAMTWQQQANFDPNYGTADSSSPDYIS